jgi:hypothetical protein
LSQIKYEKLAQMSVRFMASQRRKLKLSKESEK